MEVERASPRMVTRAGTTLTPEPPEMNPKLAVVSSAMRPSFIFAMASAAT